MNLAERHQWADDDFFSLSYTLHIYSLGRKEPLFCEYSWLSLQLQQKESSRPLSVIFFLQVILLVAAFFDACNRSLFGLRDIFIKQQ